MLATGNGEFDSNPSKITLSHLLSKCVVQNSNPLASVVADMFGTQVRE